MEISNDYEDEDDDVMTEGSDDEDD